MMKKLPAGYRDPAFDKGALDEFCDVLSAMLCDKSINEFVALNFLDEWLFKEAGFIFVKRIFDLRGNALSLWQKPHVNALD